MKTLSLIFTFCCFVIQLSAQKPDIQKIAEAIQDEGETLYRSEWASWYGTDIFLDKCKDKRDKIAGYLSYDSGKGLVNIFFSKGDDPRILATTTFDYGFDREKYVLDTTGRSLTKYEKELHNIRQVVIAAIKTDTIYKHFNNARLNPVPLIYKGVKKVYVLTGPNVNGVVLFGNDYLITFNKKNEIVSTTKLHNSLISIKVDNNPADSSKRQVTSVHNHVKGKDEFITVTDICTLMLYKKFTTWQNSIVVSNDYTSIWDCEKNKLVILTTDAVKRISADDKK